MINEMEEKMRHCSASIRKTGLVLCMCAIGFAVSGQAFAADPIMARVDSLMSMMTLEEKVGQLVQVTEWNDTRAEQLRNGALGSIIMSRGATQANEIQKVAVEESRLGIPVLFGYDVIHGYRTTFPIPLAESCSWNPELATRDAAVAAGEARAAGIPWTFAPMSDIARDARWGRIAEGAGEDPYLGAAFAAARVRGFQGNGLNSDNAVMATLKHYVAYGAAIAGKDYNSVDMSERMLRDVYLPPFKAGVEAGAGSVMSSFNSLNGIPATANKFTLDRVLRQEWGFDGFVVSDWEAVNEMIIHGYAADGPDAVMKALAAGTDMDMKSDHYQRELADLVREGDVSMEAVDTSCRRILYAKFALGLFDYPYTDESREQAAMLTPDNIAAARQAARESIVLLKNDGDLLPLSRNVRSIALIGPLGDNPRDMLGSWSARGNANDAVSILAGLRAAAGNDVDITFTDGCDIDGASRDGFDAAVEAARNAGVAILAVGESSNMSGEARSRADIGLPGVQLDLVKAVQATGTPVVAMLVSGRPMSIPWIADEIPAVVEAWQLGVQAGNAIADVLFGDYNPSGKLTTSFPRTVGQEPLYYNYDNTGRPVDPDNLYTSRYMDVPNTPVFPFGYGMSYTTFEYDGLALSAEEIGPQGTLTVTARVRNTGSRAGDEVAQLYIRDRVASLIRPVKELKGFTKIHLEPGAEQTVTFTLGPDELGFHNPYMEFVVEPGEFDVWVGPNSQEGLHGMFTVAE